MDFTILLIYLLLIGAFIFILIKYFQKLLHLFVSFFLFLLLLIVFAFAIVSFDYAKINEIDKINFAYKDENNKILFVESLEVDNITQIKTQNIKSLSSKEIEDLISNKQNLENEVLIIFNKNLIDNISNLDAFLEEVDLDELSFLTKAIKPSQILESDDKAFDIEIENKKLKNLLFLYLVKDSLTNIKDYQILLDEYKNENLEIYPKRFSLLLIKYLPIGPVRFIFSF